MFPAPEDPLARVLVIDDSKTILKVVGAILQNHGYSAVTASDGVEGFERLQNDGPFDMVLLDFVMPRMNGYQFCRKLRADKDFSSMAVVLMSARTDAIGDRFVEQTGAIDALGKPFDARALIAVVGNALAKVAEGSVARPLPAADTMIDEEDLDRQPESMPPASRHFRTLSALAQQIANVATPALNRLRPEQLQDPDLVANAIAMSMNDEVLAGISQTMDQLGPPSNKDEALRGDLEKVPLAELLQFLQLQRLTGVLRVANKGKSMVVYVREGMVDLVQSEGTDEEFRLGRYFVKHGLLTRDELTSILKETSENKLLGDLLVDKEKVTEEQRTKALTEQSSELTYELVRWPAGHFILTKEELSAEAKSAKLGLGVSNLVLEGFRRVDEWRQMEKSIDFDAVVVVDTLTLGTVDDEAIGEAEIKILRMVDGEHSVRDIINECDLATFDVISILYRFLQSRIVRTKAAAGAAGAGTMQSSMDVDKDKDKDKDKD